MIRLTIIILSILFQVHAHTRTTPQQRKLSPSRLLVVDDTILNRTNLRQNLTKTLILNDSQHLYILARWRDHLAAEVENNLYYAPQRRWSWFMR